MSGENRSIGTSKYLKLRKYALLDIKYKIKHARREHEAHEVEDLVVEGERAREVGESEEGKDDHDEGCQDKKPLCNNRCKVLEGKVRWIGFEFGIKDMVRGER